MTYHLVNHQVAKESAHNSILCQNRSIACVLLYLFLRLWKANDRY